MIGVCVKFDIGIVMEFRGLIMYFQFGIAQRTVVYSFNTALKGDTRLIIVE